MKKTPPLVPYRTEEEPQTEQPQKPPLWRRLFNALLWMVRWIVRLIVMTVLLIVCAAGGAYAGLKYSLDAQLPDISKLERYSPVETTEIMDAQGRLLYRMYGEENRKVVALQSVPELVQKAVLAAEDARFYEHQGVDPIGLLRALKVNYDTGAAVQGGSTITQQVVKNLFLTPDRTVRRKLAEMWISRKVEERYSKAQILELYLNQVYWGHNAYGIQAAAQNYFGKKTHELTLAEGALLAGILTGPELFSPYRSKERAKQRQKLTLKRMVEVGFISPQEADQALKASLRYPGIKRGVMKYPYFTSYVLATLKRNYGESDVFKRGMRVYTTINPAWQDYAQKTLRDHIHRNRRARVSQAAMVLVENQTGFVRAIVGGTDFEQSQFNRAWQAHRQPGSAFKPFVYLTAFARGYRPEHLEVDEPIVYQAGGYQWRPRNYAGGHYGSMTLQKALESSNNIIAVKMGERVGNSNVIDTAHRLGIRSRLKAVLSLPLGPNEVSPLEMATAYSSIARGGAHLESTPILRIEDRFGNLIEDNRRRTPDVVYSRTASSHLIQVMKGVIERGTAPQARLGRPAAGKTGTTSDHKDAWFVGFTPQYTAAVWVGNDKPVRMYGAATGGRLAAPLWKKVMRHIHAKLPREDFTHAKGLLPLLSGVAIDDTQDAGTGFMPRYRSLNQKREAAPLFIDPSELDFDFEDFAVMTLPEARPEAKPERPAPRRTQPPARRENAQIVDQLDDLIKELDRLELPIDNE